MKIRLCRFPIFSYLLFYSIPIYLILVALVWKPIYLLCSGQVSFEEYKDVIIFLCIITALFIASYIICFIIWRAKGKFLLVIYPNKECEILNNKKIYLSFKLDDMEIKYDYESFVSTWAACFLKTGIAQITVFPDCLDRKHFYFGVNRFLVRHIKRRLNIIKNA